MLRYVYIGLALLFLNNVFATEVIVELKEVDVADGVIYLAICDENNFSLEEQVKKEKTNCFAGVSMKVNGSKEYKFVFAMVPEGDWAIFGYIDENNSGKLEKTDRGLPKETVIFNRELKGEPRFRDIKSVIKGEKQTIKLIAQ